jgi:ABC-type glycerol-3-phosphate transport system substrate-binding protein
LRRAPPSPRLHLRPSRVRAAQTTQELYDKAKQEGELVLYGGGPTSLYEVPARAFEQRYPGIKVTIHAGFSNVHNQAINAQLKSGKLDADLAILQTVADFIDWKKAGVLAAFKPDGWDAIDQTFKDADGHSACSSPRSPMRTIRRW